MNLNPAEISQLIKSRIEGLGASSDIRNQGTVVSVTDGICRVHGLSDAMQGEMLEFPATKDGQPTYGLALNLGGHAPLDVAFLRKLRGFLAATGARCYSEHLSYCGDHAHLYDLMPLPFTVETVCHVAGRIRQAQDILGFRMAVENVSYYAAPSVELSEIEFLNAVLEEADCLLHLDINNIYVNSVNHGYDAQAYLCAVPGKRIAYAHVAGHHQESEHLRIDTHGADVIEPVWQLLDLAYATHGVFPTLLERDFDIPPLEHIIKEVEIIEACQARHAAPRVRRLAHV